MAVVKFMVIVMKKKELGVLLVVNPVIQLIILANHLPSPVPDKKWLI